MSRIDQQGWHLKNTWKELSLAVLYKYTCVFNKLHVLWVSVSVFPLLVEWNNVLSSEQHARESKGTAQRKQEETQWAKHVSRPWSNISQSLTDTFPCATSWCKKALCVSISHNSTSNTPNYPLNTEADSKSGARLHTTVIFMQVLTPAEAQETLANQPRPHFANDGQVGLPRLCQHPAEGRQEEEMQEGSSHSTEALRMTWKSGRENEIKQLQMFKRLKKKNK